MIRSWRVEAGGELTVREHPLPAVDEDRVVVEVHGAVIGRAERAALTEDTERVCGGAAAGVVVDTGPAATELRDKRVLVGPLMPCGECDTCRRGAAAACPHGDRLGATVDGAVASHVVARGRWLLPLENELEVPGPNAALLAREAAVAYAAFARAGIHPSEPVLVVGDGLVARFVAEVAAAKGAQPFVATADVEERLAAAGHADKPRRIFETTADNEARQRAVALCNPGATITLLSAFAAGARRQAGQVEVEPWLSDHAQVLGCAGAHPDFFAEVVALAVREQLDIGRDARVIGPSELAEAVRQGDAPSATAWLLDPRTR